MIFTRRAHIGYYNFALDIHYDFGLDIPLLFTKKEAYRAVAMSKIMTTLKFFREELNGTQSQHDTKHALGSVFFKLRREIRENIYAFALPKGQWTIRDYSNSNELNFARGIGDPSGFYFPLTTLNVLTINRQMRQEALPIAYRTTSFHLDDIDDLIKLLIAIGRVGRDNIESLELAWQSRTDSEYQWDKAPVPTEYELR